MLYYHVFRHRENLNENRSLENKFESNTHHKAESYYKLVQAEKGHAVPEHGH